jgi:hypothetical protein
LLCRRSDTVAVGKVTGIVRAAHTPQNCPDGSIHTVCQFSVEHYLWSAGAPTSPRVLRVFQDGGTLGGVTEVLEGCPLLNVGDRYLLFLQRAQRDYLTMSGGVWGPSVMRGEYLISDRIEGKFLLRGGRTLAASDPYQVIQPWQFQSGPAGLRNLLGLAEEAAILKVWQGILGVHPGPAFRCG